MRNPLLGELLHSGGDIRKGIGLVRKRPGYDAHFLTLSQGGLGGCGNRLWFEPAHLSHKFIRTHPLGKPIADRHDTDVGSVYIAQPWPPDRLSPAVDCHRYRSG